MDQGARLILPKADRKCNSPKPYYMSIYPIFYLLSRNSQNLRSLPLTATVCKRVLVKVVIITPHTQSSNCYCKGERPKVTVVSFKLRFTFRILAAILTGAVLSTFPKQCKPPSHLGPCSSNNSCIACNDNNKSGDCRAPTKSFFARAVMRDAA